MKLYKTNVINNYKISKRVVNFLNPEYACVLSKTVGSTKGVYKGKLFESNDLDSFSTISGEVSGYVNVSQNNKIKKCIFIKNDFKETNVLIESNKLECIDEFLSLIKETNFYNKFINKDVKNIIINSIIDEPLVITESYILKSLSDKIIDTVNTLNRIYKLDRSLLVFKNNENDNIGQYLSKSGSYTHMNVVVLDDLYLLGSEDILLNKLGYNKSNSVVLKPSEVLELRNLIKNKRYMTEKYISVVDTVEKKIKIVYTKKNIIVSELLNKLKYTHNNYTFFKNGIIRGEKINVEKEIITSDFNALFIIKNKISKENKCINCGKCVSVCPKGVDPKEVYMTKKIDPRCIDCGLCTVVCPVNLILNNGGKNELYRKKI